MDLREGTEVGRRRPVAAACLLFLLAAALTSVCSQGWRTGRLLSWDSRSYQLYLTGAVVHQDLLTMTAIQQVDSTTGRVHYGEQNALIWLPPTRTAVNKYPIGPALFQAPFFLMAHGYCLLFKPDAITDGFGPPYQLATAFASACWATLGLWITGLALLRWVSPTATCLTLLGLGLGTNLFFYSTHGAGMAHAYAFFLVAWAITSLDGWLRHPTPARAIGTGVAVGLLLCTRSVDLLVLLAPILVHLRNREARRRTWQHLRQRPGHLLLGAAALLLAFLPQMLYWYFTVGRWLVDTYGDEPFGTSHLLQGLFGARKGWYLYSPLMLVATGGLFLAIRRRDTRAMGIALAVTLFIYAFVVFSWWNWWYGGGFGARPMVDILFLMAWPLALVLERGLRAGTPGRIAVLGLLVATISLNLFQQWQYSEGILRWDGMTWERYVEIFGATGWEGLAPFDP